MVSLEPYSILDLTIQFYMGTPSKLAGENYKNITDIITHLPECITITLTSSGDRVRVSFSSERSKGK